LLWAEPQNSSLGIGNPKIPNPSGRFLLLGGLLAVLCESFVRFDGEPEHLRREQMVLRREAEYLRRQAKVLRREQKVLHGKPKHLRREAKVLRREPEHVRRELAHIIYRTRHAQ
jgi:hypothetical protein